MNTKVNTLTSQLMVGTGAGDQQVNLARALISVQSAIRQLAAELRLPGLTKAKQFQVTANRIWLDNLVKSRSIKYIVTSKSKAVIEVDAEYAGDLTITYNALVGNTQFDPAFTSIFTIYGKYPNEASLIRQNEQSIADLILQPGKNILAAGLCVYGANTSLILAVASGAFQYQLNERSGEFDIVEPLTLAPHRHPCLETQDNDSTSSSHQVVHSSHNFVLDVYDALLRGFVYRSPELNLMCGAAAIAFIFEKCEGSALLLANPNSNSSQAEHYHLERNSGKFVRICDLSPNDLHTTVRLIAGHTHDIMKQAASKK